MNDTVNVNPGEDSVSNLTDDELMSTFDEVRGATRKGLSLQFGLDEDAALDVVHRALVRFLRDTPDEDLFRLGAAAKMK